MDGIKRIARDFCLICNTAGEIAFNQLKDQLFSAPEKWSLSQCPNCKLIWLNPYPAEDELGKLYQSYYTHENIRKNFLSKLVSFFESDVLHSLGYQTSGRAIVGSIIPFFKEYVALGIMGVKKSWGNKLLDVGCGNGEYLNKMKNLGWEVEGQETDPKAAQFANEKYKLKIHVGDLLGTNLPTETFDVVTLNHVIEHVIDPEKLLSECYRILKPGGRLVLLTPNVESLGYKLFRQNWRGLEVPRHMAVFSVSNLGVLVKRAGFAIDKLTSSARIARYLYSTSVHIKEGRSSIGGGGNRGYWLALKSYLFQAKEEMQKLFNDKVGEEIVFVGIKKIE